MKNWVIPVSWECCGTIDVEAETLEKALEIFDKNIDEYELPTNEQYVQASFEREDDDYIKEYNKSIDKTSQS